MHEGRAAIKRDLDRQKKGSDRAPMLLGPEQCATLSQAGRVSAVLLMGLGLVPGRRSWALVGSQLSRGQPFT